MRSPMKIHLSIVLILLALTGCKAGSGEDLDEQGRPLDEAPVVEPIDVTTPPDDGIKATLTSIQENVFTPICATCHGGANPAAGQDLSSLESSIANLINIDSSNALFKRVLPGSAAESYLYLKIAGDSRAGARMPLGQPALDEASIAAIKKWIDDGALLPQSASTMAKVSRTVTSMTKKTDLTPNNLDQLLSQSDYIWREKEPLSIIFWFNKAMNFDHLTKDQILVSAYNANEITANQYFVSNKQVSVHVINDHTLQISVQNLAQNVTKLAIRLNEGSISTLVTKMGQTLDGDDNGVEGGAFNYELFL